MCLQHIFPWRNKKTVNNFGRKRTLFKTTDMSWKYTYVNIPSSDYQYSHYVLIDEEKNFSIIRFLKSEWNLFGQHLMFLRLCILYSDVINK